LYKQIFYQIDRIPEGTALLEYNIIKKIKLTLQDHTKRQNYTDIIEVCFV